MESFSSRDSDAEAIAMFKTVTGVEQDTIASAFLSGAKGVVDDAINNYLECVSGGDSERANQPPSKVSDDINGAQPRAMTYDTTEKPTPYRLVNEEMPRGDLHRSAGHMRTKDMMRLRDGRVSAAGESIGSGAAVADALIQRATAEAEAIASGEPPVQPELRVTSLMTPMQRTLTLWKNGFTIDEGPLRDYDDPQNAALLSVINRGMVPSELKDPKNLFREIELQTVEKRAIEYVKQFKAFEGVGHRLGDAQSDNSTGLADATATGGGERSNDLNFEDFPDEFGYGDKKSHAQHVVNEMHETTSVSIRLSTGTRILGHFNQDHTVKDLYRFVSLAQSKKFKFELRTTFPPKPVVDMNLTLKQAGLLNAAVVQRAIT